MTDRAHSLTVALDHDTRDDDLESLMSAILLMRGVIGVEMNVADAAAYTYEHRVDVELHELLLAARNAIAKGGIKKATAALNSVQVRPSL